MFKELYPLAQSAPIALMIAAEGDELRVTVHQKETKKGKPLQLSIVATPTELDENLPASIADAVEAVFAKAPVAEQVKSQVAKTPAPATPKAASAPKKQTKPAPAKATPKAKAPAKPIKPTTAKPLTKSDTPAEGTNKRPTKDDCLAEFKELYAAHGSALNREKYLELATKTGRSFERLFGGWHKFVAAAGLQSTEKDDDNLELPLATGLNAGETQSTGPLTTSPEVKTEACDERKADDTEQAPSLTTPPAQTLPERWPFPERTDDAGPSPQPTASRVRRVILADGTELCKEVRDLAIGDEIHVHEAVYLVMSHGVDGMIIVQPKDPPPPAPKVRKIIDDEGEQRGTQEGEVAVGQTVEAIGGNFTVVRITDKAVFVAVAGEEVSA